MTVAILIASVTAAVTGLVGIGLAIWWHSSWPELKFTSEWAVAEDEITFVIRLRNRGGGTLHQLDLFGLAAGETFRPGSKGTLGRFKLQPGDLQLVEFPVARPERVDIGPDDVQPTLKVQIYAVALYGRRRKIVEYPAGRGAFYALPASLASEPAPELRARNEL